MKTENNIPFNKEFSEEQETNFPESIKDKNPFSVPENYFDELSVSVMNKCSSDQKSTLSSLIRAYIRKHTAVALYFAGIFILVMSSFFIINEINRYRVKPSFLANNQNQNSKIAGIEDTANKAERAGYSSVSINHIQLTSDITTDDIINYLDNDIETDSFYNDL